MPGTITHFWIFRETLRRLPDRGAIAEMKQSNEALEARLRRDHSRWRSNYNYADYASDSLLASYGYLGAAGPDLFLAPDDSFDAMVHIDGIELSDLMHYNKAGSFIIFLLRRIKRSLVLPRSSTRRTRYTLRLAYCIGHITHIAADVCMHPLVNTMAGAYHTNTPRQFENSEGGNPIDIFMMHHKIEHYQDSYTRTEFFENEARLPADDWEMLAFPRTACLHIDSNAANRFLVRELEDFYHYRTDTLYGRFTRDEEGGKMDYFFDTSVASHVSFRNYCVNIIPSMNRMRSERDAQGRPDLETVVQPPVFRRFVGRAVDLAVAMAGEAVSYLYDDRIYSNAGPEENLQMYREKQETFRLLRQAWNLDCGLGFRFEASPETATFTASNKRLHLPLVVRVAGPEPPVYYDGLYPLAAPTTRTV